IVAIALIAPMVIMPVGSAYAQEKCFYERVKYLDIEIKVINGQPMFVYETEKGYKKIPFSMSDLGDYAYAYGQKVPLKTQGNSILVPTEEGPVAVPIEEFDVVVVDGEIMLIAEENPFWKAPIAVALKRAGVKVTTQTIKTVKRVVEEVEEKTGVPAWFVLYYLVRTGVLAKAAYEFAGVHPVEFLTPVQIEMIRRAWEEYQRSR
ncbi:hypothetical protein M1N80_03790, partial [Peptococcaceae bacterium]|nr:hypothetical protein [Peptococcaceae bacterium]